MKKNEIKTLSCPEECLADVWLKLNGFISIEGAESITTLDKTTQYLERML